ncbi:acetoacetate--CoA ligase [Edaphobacillus lindanitolerans]|uniref:Acetoacetyl-CoA synthetase n=1 Tax=Edaphobacillus lindanitolerans TaxID=550447 RepID=A0A1U7PN35_9BACI|nr:acetoacetate--CoA ligase [Edaphobacillus lindanitolerans]SIT73399.1 acetoacetyl-CoA synthetase [Edaphobacillus lindanitolerans]
MTGNTQGKVIWTPSGERIEKSVMTDYMDWLKKEKGVQAKDYTELWKWSVDELEPFWESIWQYCGVAGNRSYSNVLQGDSMIGAKWFSGATLNFTENIFSERNPGQTALYFRSESTPTRSISWGELEKQVASVAKKLKDMGVKAGDRVAAYLPNIPEAAIAFLATASVGAVWSICSPDFGSKSVITRFGQIEPVVFIAVDGYSYNGKTFDKRSDVEEIRKQLPTVKQAVFVPYIGEGVPESYMAWEELLEEDVPLAAEPMPFDHPLWIVYSSGTTGLPKPIVHSHGGIVLEHKKLMAIQHDLGPDDVVFWFSSTGWIMWNLLIGSWLACPTIVLYDGSPSSPDWGILWELAEETGITFFGTSAPFIAASAKIDARPKEKYDLHKLRSVFSTGAPLTADGYEWIYEHVKSDVWLVSVSGGTDISAAFVGGVPIEPVRIGEIQGRSLGVAADAFDEEGNSLIDEVGELVVTKPMPSMPLYFWGDEGNERYHESYFDHYPGIWKHGDWIKIDGEGRCIIYGRSDSTINRSGVRMGTSDLYRVIAGVDEVFDSLVIDLEVIGKSASLLLFVVLKEGAELNEDLEARIKQEIREQLSPRFAPDRIYQVEDIPKTLNGKKLEVPIRKLLLGFEAERVINADSMSNPESLPFFLELAKELEAERTEKLFS